MRPTKLFKLKIKKRVAEEQDGMIGWRDGGRVCVSDTRDTQAQYLYPDVRKSGEVDRITIHKLDKA